MTLSDKLFLPSLGASVSRLEAKKLDSFGSSDRFLIVALWGQSNMGGGGLPGTLDLTINGTDSPDDKLFMWTEAGNIEPARPPLKPITAFDSACVDPGFLIGKQIAFETGSKVLLVSGVAGGTKLGDGLGGTGAWCQGGARYTSFMDRVNAAVAATKGHIYAVFCQIGEDDSAVLADANAFKTNMVNTINNMRNDFVSTGIGKSETVPFVLSTCTTDATYSPNAAVVNSGLLSIMDDAAPTHVVVLDNTDLARDDQAGQFVHYTADARRIFARRMVSALQNAQADVRGRAAFTDAKNTAVANSLQSITNVGAGSSLFKDITGASLSKTANLKTLTSNGVALVSSTNELQIQALPSLPTTGFWRIYATDNSGLASGVAVESVGLSPAATKSSTVNTLFASTNPFQIHDKNVSATGTHATEIDSYTLPLAGGWTLCGWFAPLSILNDQYYAGSKLFNTPANAGWELQFVRRHLDYDNDAVIDANETLWGEFRFRTNQNETYASGPVPVFVGTRWVHVAVVTIDINASQSGKLKALLYIDGKLMHGRVQSHLLDGTIQLGTANSSGAGAWLLTPGLWYYNVPLTPLQVQRHMIDNVVTGAGAYSSLG